MLMGQLLALIIVSNSKISEILEKKRKFVTPLLLISMYYFFLFWLWFLVNRKLKLPKPIYFLIIALDSQANFLMIYAFSIIPANFVFVVSVQSVFWTVVLSLIIVRNYKYKLLHFVGLVISLGGVCVTLYGCLTEITNNDEFYLNIKGLLFSIGASVGFSM
jgi:drug/metabolite transporter (DMT)-like permease